jgi:molybdopterin/thiamine biosynthesis adenylyltransferase
VSDRFSRQSFLGQGAEDTISTARIAVVGLGGGGSHVVQQLAHVGFRNFVLYDGDIIESSNLNRLIGGTTMDVAMKLPKTLIAERVIRGLAPDAVVHRIEKRWQKDPEPLRSCDVVVGCVDGYRERWELQVASRRFLIPLIDVGLDVRTVAPDPPRMSGQVILSIPGGPCLRCMRFITDENLGLEAQRYGDAGPRAQVVWANGVLASAAAGILVELLTGWTRRKLDHVYLSYDGNMSTLTADRRSGYIERPCQHFSPDDVGEPSL